MTFWWRSLGGVLLSKGSQSPGSVERESEGGGGEGGRRRRKKVDGSDSVSDEFSHEEMADDRVKLMWGRRIISDVGIIFICLSLPVPPLAASGNPLPRPSSLACNHPSPNFAIHAIACHQHSSN